MRVARGTGVGLARVARGGEMGVVAERVRVRNEMVVGVMGVMGVEVPRAACGRGVDVQQEGRASTAVPSIGLDAPTLTLLLASRAGVVSAVERCA